MSDQLPMFPLSTVVFPGMSVPLHVFEDRYRLLVRHLLEEMQRGTEFPHGVVAVLPEPEVEVPTEVLDRARATFTAFRVAMTELQGDPFSGSLPRDPDYLAWTLSALAPLPMAERQSLLEAEDATERLTLVTRLLTEELRAINVIPSLPATQVARTAWSPN